MQSRVVAFISNLKGRFQNFMPKKSPSGAVRVLDIERERSTINEFRNIVVPKDPYISPYLASDSALKQLPPLKILVSLPLDFNIFFLFSLLSLKIVAINVKCKHLLK